MKHTSAYSTDTNRSGYSMASAVPFFRSRWGLFTLLTLGSGLYLYQRRGGSVKALFSRIWDMGMNARNSIGSIAPSASSSTADTTGDVGTFASDAISTSRQSSPRAGI